MYSLNRVLVAAAVVTLLASACSDDPGESSSTSASPTASTTSIVTTTVASGDFVFGSGVLPGSVPADFPLPNGSIIDSTLVNTVTGFTEASILVPAEVDIAGLFFEQNLLARDYEYDAEQRDGGARWVVTFSKDGVAGTIDISTAGAGLSRAVLTIPGSA